MGDGSWGCTNRLDSLLSSTRHISIIVTESASALVLSKLNKHTRNSEKKTTPGLLKGCAEIYLIYVQYLERQLCSTKTLKY